jgi:hypothetical protein
LAQQQPFLDGERFAAVFEVVELLEYAQQQARFLGVLAILSALQNQAESDEP